MQIGDMRIDAIVDGECLSPKDRLYVGGRRPQDAEWAAGPHAIDPTSGQVLMSVGGYLIRLGDRVVLNDAGLGPRILGAFRVGGLRSSLLAHGVHPDEVTDVIYSHLHVDHVGWTTVAGHPFFPNAALWIDRREWVHHTTGREAMAAWEAEMAASAFGSIAALFEPVSDRMRLFETESEILPGIRALDAAGHSPGSTVFELESRGEKGLLIGDLAHTVGELLYDWELGFHHDPKAAIVAIARFRARLLRERLPFAAAHFPGLPWGRLEVGAEGRPEYHLDRK